MSEQTYYARALAWLQAAHDALFENDKRDVLGMSHGPFSGVNVTLGIIIELERKIKAEERDAARYRYIRNRPEDTIGKGGVFAGMTPPTGRGGLILTEEDLDVAVDDAMVGALQ